MKRRLAIALLVFGIAVGILSGIGTYMAKTEYEASLNEGLEQLKVGQFGNAFSSASHVNDTKKTLNMLYVLDGLCVASGVIGIISLVIENKNNN